MKENPYNTTPLFVSIIVPVYNVEKYLEECLHSLLAQTYPHLEIICVNDGSTDGSGTILADFAKRDTRITIITHEKNESLGAARNSGFKIAKGDYIYFLDSDDYIAPTTMEALVEIALQDKSDIIQFPVLCYDMRTGNIYPASYFELPIPPEKFSICIDAFQEKFLAAPSYYLFYFTAVIFVGNKMFKRSFIAPFRFPEKVFFEDTPFYYECMLNVDRWTFTNTSRACFYYRVNREGSIMYTTRRKANRVLQLIDIMETIVDKFRQYKPELIVYGKSLQMWMIFNQIQLNKNFNEFRLIIKEIIRVLRSLQKEERKLFWQIVTYGLKHKLAYGIKKKYPRPVRYVLYFLVLCKLIINKLLIFLGLKQKLAILFSIIIGIEKITPPPS